MMTQVKQGDTVRVHYTGKLTDGMLFDSSEGREPLEFTLGAGNVIPGFEAAVVGMSAGESKTVNIDSAQAYGPRSEDAVRKLPREGIPQEIQLEAGLQLQASDPQGRPIMFTVLEVEEETVTLDANHPLAGKDLVFELELVEIV
jgi:peptidylprolyl isomerase